MPNTGGLDKPIVYISSKVTIYMELEVMHWKH